MSRPAARALILFACLGCGRTPAPPAESDQAPPARTAQEQGPKAYKLVGVVREVDPQAGEVTIRHEAIPGFMPAMTMPFRVTNRAALDDVHPGDKVEGTLRVSGEASDLADLVVTEEAPPPELAVDAASGTAGLRPKPEPLRPGEPVPDFAMTTQDGRPLKLSDLRGEVVVLTFIYTRCPLPDYCPAMDRRFGELARRLKAAGRAAGVRLLSVSFDPEHDTPEALARHARLQGATPPLWTFAVASHAELSKVAAALGLIYAPREDEIMHNLSTTVIGPDGRLVRREKGKDWSADGLLKSILAAAAPADPGRPAR